MTINDIMLRDMFDAEKEKREAERKGAERGETIVKWACAAGGVLAVVTLVFLAWCCISDAAHVFNISR